MEQAQGGSQARHGCFFCDVVGPQLEALFEHCWPEPTQEHFRNARIEALKGIRSLLDARIDRLSQRTRKGTSVPVE